MSGNDDDARRSGMGHIQKVDAATPAPEGDGWGRAASAFSPLGMVAEAYARTLAYRLEGKRLAIELRRVNAEFEVRKGVIDKTFKLKMEELEQRRLVLNRYFDTVQQQLKQLHIERVKILSMIDLAMKKTLEPGLSLEERRMFKEMVTEMSATLPVYAEKANQSLETLVKALPTIDMPRALLQG